MTKYMISQTTQCRAIYFVYAYNIIISHVVYVLWKIGLFTKTRPLSVSCQIFQRIERFSPAPKNTWLRLRRQSKHVNHGDRSLVMPWSNATSLFSGVEPTIEYFRSCFRRCFFSEAVATAPEYVDDGAAAHRWLHRACSCSAWDKWRISEWQRHRTAFTALKSHASKFDKLTPCFKSLEVFMVHWSYSTQSIQ